MHGLRLMALVGVLASTSFATDYTWTGSTGSFQTDSNWSPAGVPGATDNAKFTTAGMYAVSFNGNATNASSTVGADVTIGLGGYAWLLSGGLTFSGTSTARVGGGYLEMGSAVTLANNQKLVLNSGTSWLKGTKLETSAGGAIEVNGGDHVLAWAMPLGSAPSGGSSFRMTGGRLSMTNNDNAARCTLNNGARMALEGGTLSIRYQVDIQGSGSAPAVIDIYTNAALLQCPGIGFNVGRNAGGLGIVNIRGGSLLLSNSNFNVMNANSMSVTTGLVNLVDGKALAGNLTIGFNSNGVAMVRQTGGQMLVTGETYLGKERNTRGFLTQEGGDAWYNGFYVGGFLGGTGEVNLAGGTLAVTGASGAIGKVAGSSGRMSQTGGQLIISNSFSVGGSTGAVGVYTNTGGSLWMSGTLYLGNGGAGAVGRAYFSGLSNYVQSAIILGNNSSATGSLTVAGGALTADGAVTVGNTANSSGSLDISGGTLSVTNGTVIVGNSANAVGSIGIWGGTGVFSALTVGNSGLGSLSVAGGLLIVPGGAVLVGNGAGSSGSMELSGGSLWAANGTLSVGQATGSKGTVSISGGENLLKGVTVGNSGTGTLSITGGLLTMTNGVTLMVGNTIGSAGTVTISGGTNIFCGAGLTVGQNGYGLGRITGGYVYTTNRVVVGGGAGATGRLELAGGVLSAPIIDGRDTTLTNNPGGYAEVLFDGGTLQHSADTESWMRDQFVSWFAKAALTGRGAVIDSNGGTLIIPQALSNEVGHAGSFTKKGAGRLTLTSWYNAFTGQVAVREGELIVPVSGAIYLTGGVAIDAGALLNLFAAGAVRDLMTAPGTVSRIDGALSLKSGVVLTNGVGATLGGSGVVTGKVVFASGSVFARDKANSAGPLQVTAGAAFQAGVAVRLTGYTVQDLNAGIPLAAASAGVIQVSGRMPVTLDGMSHPYWWAQLSVDGKTLTARVIPLGTMISVW